MDGKTARGASSPAKPAFTSPEPLSHTRAVVSSSSHILAQLRRGLQVENRVARPHCLRWRWPPPTRRKGQSRGGLGATGGTPAVSLPVGAGEEGWEEAAEVEGDVHRAGERRPPRLPGQESRSVPGARRYRHPLASPPQPFTCLPFRELRAHLGPNHTPTPKPPLEGNAHDSRDPKRPVGAGAAGFAFCAPLSCCDDPGQQKLEPNPEVWSLKKKKKKVAARQ